MSKKNRNKFRNQNTPGSAEGESLIDIDQLGGEETVEETTDELEAAREEAATEEAAVETAPIGEPCRAPADAEPVAEGLAPDKDPEEPKAEEAVAPAAAEEKKEEPVAAPAASEEKPQVAQIPVPEKKVIVRIAGARPAAMAKPRIPNARAVTQLQQMSSEDLSKHSIVGRQVIKMFDEYINIRKTMNPKNPADRNRAARKLYDIVVACCPRNSSNRNAAYDHELIMICFKNMSKHFGTYFTDKSLLLGDYTLPSPSEAIKFDAFYGALYQLADAAKTGARITFNMKTLETLLNAPGAARALQTIKERLEAR
jgi:hypothetical protein